MVLNDGGGVRPLFELGQGWLTIFLGLRTQIVPNNDVI